MTDDTASVQIVRYVVIGGLNTLFAYLIYALAIYAGLHYALAVFLGGVIPLLTGYALQRRFVFSFHGGNRLARYIAVFILVYFANTGIITLLLDSGITGSAYLGGAIALSICTLLNFALNKSFVFR